MLRLQRGDARESQSCVQKLIMHARKTSMLERPLIIESMFDMQPTRTEVESGDSMGRLPRLAGYFRTMMKRRGVSAISGQPTNRHELVKGAGVCPP